jgi:hypothetical protein
MLVHGALYSLRGRQKLLAFQDGDRWLLFTPTEWADPTRAATRMLDADGTIVHRGQRTRDTVSNLRMLEQSALISEEDALE